MATALRCAVPAPADILLAVGAIDADAVRELHPRVRDREDLRVLRCERSGVIFLSSAEHMTFEHYEDKLPDASIVDGTTTPRPVPLADDTRRAGEIGDVVAGKRWLDVGTGEGALLDLLRDVAAAAIGVEPTEVHRRAMRARGLTCHRSVDDVTGEPFDVATLFHVLEHLVDPVGVLAAIGDKMAVGGHLRVEVPHARDLLLSTAACEAFKDFTFWSEHLVLHTRASLAAVLHTAGFVDVEVHGVQRYPVSNHLHWLAAGRPGGHVVWSDLDTPALTAAYEQALDQLDSTDTIVATARWSGPKP